MTLHRGWIRLAAALVVCGFCAPTETRAQVGTTTEIIAGRVTGADSLPIASARVEVVSLATGVIKRTTTRADGRFSLLFRDGGTQFRVTVNALGWLARINSGSSELEPAR